MVSKSIRDERRGTRTVTGHRLLGRVLEADAVARVSEHPTDRRPARSRWLLGVSLKMYFDYERTRVWLKQVRRLAPLPPGSGLFVLPAFPSLPDAERILRGSGIHYGAQDVWYEAAGPYTGEVSADMLKQLGCLYVAIGHAERRQLFGETNALVALKAIAATKAGLIPVICVGEKDRGARAPVAVTRQLRASLDGVPELPLVVAYEPVWAIGAAEPAPPGYISSVVSALREFLSGYGGASRILYGGAAGPGTLSALVSEGPQSAPDGLFLGRYAHSVDDLSNIIHELPLMNSPAPAMTVAGDRSCVPQKAAPC